MGHKARQGEEKEDFQPGAGTRRRGGAALRLGVVSLVALRRVRAGPGAWGHQAAGRVRARTWGGPSPPKIGGFTPLPGRTR
jgi:hypothetical protein